MKEVGLVFILMYTGVKQQEQRGQAILHSCTVWMFISASTDLGRDNPHHGKYIHLIKHLTAPCWVCQ